jgi:cytochrome c-type biogenesis protein CcmH
MNRRTRALFFCLSLTLAFSSGIINPYPAHAIGANEALTDLAQETRARALFQQLRCLVCQNQSIDDSEADLARDLRVLVRERIQAGDSDDAVLRYLTARYGDFVLLKPPVKGTTLVLWLAPFAILLLGGIMIMLTQQRRRAVPGPAPGPAPVALTADERARLETLLNEGQDSDLQDSDLKDPRP